MNMHHRGERGARVRCGNRLKLTGIRSLKIPGPGAVAHMSLHQKPTMSKSHRHKEADNNGSPIYTGGPVVRFYVGDRSDGTSRNRQYRVGEGPYMDRCESGQQPFAILFQRLENRRIQPFLASSPYGAGRRRFKGGAAVNDSTRPRPEGRARAARACPHPLFTLCA